ncbi:hypothetical protein O181_049796 [Austropuccinia psidii MF-1]|uniref:Uncharacterized protein n=1 Tax=Austropuccinia psidii MF-1 TaxID=1389203 RepID=A0A9Q3E0M0_9BASI|nr:hypothetical protein [Austropuccinia psidii MF-1]
MKLPESEAFESFDETFAQIPLFGIKISSKLPRNNLCCQSLSVNQDLDGQLPWKIEEIILISFFTVTQAR